MNAARFLEIAAHYSQLRLAIVGDYCLDRYLEIDPGRAETSLETGLPVHNVVRTRAQPGAAGTVLNNLVALGVGQLHLVGFRGEDGEGYELQAALSKLPGVCLDHFIPTPDRCTFTYCKPLVLEPHGVPRELNRFDSKNWTPTPPQLVERLVRSIQSLAPEVDGLIVMDQVDVAETGVVTRQVLDALADIAGSTNVIADSRRGLSGYPPVIYKMNVAELAVLAGQAELCQLDQVHSAATELARSNGRDVIVTMAERGLIGATPEGPAFHVTALPVRGAIDVVGAGDAVTANATAALAAGATLQESLQIAAAAAAVVVHQLGTTGSATAPQIAAALQGVYGGTESAPPAKSPPASA